MKVQAISNNQNFEGKVIIIGKFPKHNLETILKAKEALSDRVTFAPFDVHIKESNIGVRLSNTTNFTKGILVSLGENSSKSELSAEDYIRAYEKLRDRITKQIKEESFWEQLKYFLGIKKYVG